MMIRIQYLLWIQDAFAALIDLTPNQTAVANSIDAGDAPSDVVDYLNTGTSRFCRDCMT